MGKKKNYLHLFALSFSFIDLPFFIHPRFNIPDWRWTRTNYQATGATNTTDATDATDATYDTDATDVTDTKDDADTKNTTDTKK